MLSPDLTGSGESDFVIFKSALVVINVLVGF
jgi:hypothetical protein